MRIAITFCFIALVLSAAATAQNHPNGYAGISGSNLIIFNGTKATTLSAGSGSSYGLVMDSTNSLLLVPKSTGLIAKVDPRTSTVVGTLATGLTSPYDIAVDHNGDHFVASATTLWKVDSFGVITTVRSNLQSATGGMLVDIDTAELVIQSRTSPYRTGLVPRDGSAPSVLGSGSDPRYGIAQDYRTGDIYIGSCCGDFTPSDNVYRLANGSATASVWLSSGSAPVGVYSLKADRSSAAKQQLILGGFGASSTRGDGGFFGCELATKKVTRYVQLTLSLYETEILYRRNLAGLKTGRGTWQILTTIPEDAGYPFQLIVGASGVRSGINFPDGRRLNLTFDTLARVSATTGLAPFFTNTGGILNAKGQGVSLLNLAPLGKGANGIVLHFLALTFDPKAPLGVRTITDPFAFKIEGL